MHISKMAKGKMVVTEAHRALAQSLAAALQYNRERLRKPGTAKELAKELAARKTKVSERTIDYMLKSEKDTQLGSIVKVASIFEQQAWAMLYPGSDRDLLHIMHVYRRASEQGRRAINWAADAAEAEIRGNESKRRDTDR